MRRRPSLQPTKRGYVMDIVYLALLAILIGLCAGYLLLCTHLEDRR